VFSRANHVFAVSSYTKSRLEKLGIDDTYICENGIDPERFRSNKKRDINSAYNIDVNNSEVLLTVSRLKPHKGHKTVIRSLPQIIESFPHIIYLIAGSGDIEYKRELQKVAEDLEISNNIVFLGYVPEEHLPSLYQACDVYVMPSNASSEGVEGFGISYLEAGLCATPIIGSTSGGASSIIDNGENGYLIEPGDQDALATHITDLLDEVDQRADMGEANRQLVLERYTWDKIVQGMKKAIKENNTFEGKG